MIPIIIIAVVILFMVLHYSSRKKNKANPLEIADIIERFINGRGSSWEWDDFISVPIKDPELDKIREHCSRLPNEFPPSKKGEYISEEGLEVLKQYVKQLKEK